MTQAPTVAPARPEQREAAFRLIFRHAPPGEVEVRLANALHLVDTGELPGEGVLVAAEGNVLLGAMVCLRVPGASGLVWPPHALEGPRQQAVEDALVRHASAWLRDSGARLAQTLLPPADAPQAEPLLRNGFRHITRLWYMLHTAPESVSLFDGRLTYESYVRLADPALFARTLQRTYEATQDCPEVTGVRTMDQVIEGHQAQGQYDPERWWLVRQGGEPIGVLLLTEMPEWASLDVSYVGVVPEARGRGVGRAIMVRALREAAFSGIGRVTLSVDARNEPAWRLYRQLGFEAQDEREVYLALWGPSPGPTTEAAP